MIDLKPHMLKLEARRLLAGKYSMITPVLLTMTACTLGLEYLMALAFPSLSGIFQFLIYLICGILVNIIMSVLRGGLYMVYQKLRQGQMVRISDIFSSFSSHPEALSLYGVISFLVSFGSLSAASALFWYGPFSPAVTLALMAGLLAAVCWFHLTYGAVLYLYALAPQTQPFQLMRRSRLMTRQYRLRLLWLKLTFLGVLLLGVLAFGFGLLFALPYMQMTEILFYRRVMIRKGIIAAPGQETRED